MDNQLKKLNKLTETLKFSDFYDISFSEIQIRLQGDYDSILARKLFALGYESELNENGFVYFKNDGVTIVLS